MKGDHIMKKHNTLRRTIAVLGLLATLAFASAGMATKAAPLASVNINTASVEQLMEVPGIGLSKAQAIVEYRTNTPFATTADLVNVKGIGDKLLAKITPYVTVESGTTGKVTK
ncbi:MAG: ComEA family DNA-binding protein [Pseudomonadota bacterium]